MTLREQIDGARLVMAHNDAKPEEVRAAMLDYIDISD